jgi:hypothetical protein
MSFVAGQRLYASEFNAVIPISSRATGDLTRTSSTALTDVPGMICALEANKLYAIDGYVGYTAGETGDLKVALLAPTGATGHWALYGLSTASTGSIGDLDARRATAFGTGTTQAVGGSGSFNGDLACLLRGYVDTSSTAGDLEMVAAQNASSGTATVVREGSWLRVWELPT